MPPPVETRSVLAGMPLPAHWPRYTSLRELCTKHLDVFSVPRKSFFEWLSHFTTSELETEKLQEFISPDGQVRTITSTYVLADGSTG